MLRIYVLGEEGGGGGCVLIGASALSSLPPLQDALGVTRSPKQAKWVLCLHFRNKSAEGIELKNSAKESFRPIDRSL